MNDGAAQAARATPMDLPPPPIATGPVDVSVDVNEGIDVEVAAVGDAHADGLVGRVDGPGDVG